MVDYYSDERCNVYDGFGVTLRKACAERLWALSDAEYAAEAAARKGAA